MNGLRRILDLPNDSPLKTLLVAVSVCFVCAVLVSVSAVALRPLQAANAADARKRNILEVAGLLEDGPPLDEQFARLETRVVDLTTGRIVERGAGPAPAGEAENRAEIYFLREPDGIRAVVLPIDGKGLWSTLRGFLALEGDLDTVRAIKFHEHAETPGLGGEIDNPRWRAHWRGKTVYGDDGAVRLEVVKGAVDPDAPGARYRVDGLAGATLTGRGINAMLERWLGSDGFGPLLARIRAGGGRGE